MGPSCSLSSFPSLSLWGPAQEWAYLSKKTCWWSDWMKPCHHDSFSEFQPLVSVMFFWPRLAFQPRSISGPRVVTHQHSTSSLPCLPTLLLGVRDQREIMFKPQMKKPGWLPLMSGCSAVIRAPDLLLLPTQFAAALWSLGNCFSKPNPTTIFYLSVDFHLAK